MIRSDTSQNIQYLRAISVLSVLLYHFSPLTFSFGYLGVDVFFVISGFLMQGLYFSRNIGAKEFLVRRFIRIYRPIPLFLTVSVLLFVFLLSSEHLTALLIQIPIGVFAIANFYFYLLGSYFSGISFYQPLIHFWSLAVEIQFYFLFAFLIFLKVRIKIFYGIILLLISFLIYSLGNAFATNLSFYLTPFRLWEFGLGMLSYQLSTVQRRAIPIWILFVSTLVISLTRYDINLIAVTATAMLLSSNLRLPNVALLKFIGNKSYEIYLYHLPLLFVVKYSGIDYFALTFILIGIFGVIHVFSLSSIFITVGVFLFVLLGTIITKFDDLEKYFESHFFAEYFVSASAARNEYILSPNTKSDLPSGVVVIGDSYAQDLFNVLNEDDIQLTFIQISPRCFSKNAFHCQDYVKNSLTAANEVHLALKWEKFDEAPIRVLIGTLLQLDANIKIYASKQLGGFKRVEHWLYGINTYEFERDKHIDDINKTLETISGGNFVDLNDARHCHREVCTFNVETDGLLSFDGEHLTKSGVHFFRRHLMEN